MDTARAEFDIENERGIEGGGGGGLGVDSEISHLGNLIVQQ